MVGNSTALGLLAVEALHGEGLVLAGAPVDVGTTRQPGRPRRRGHGRGAADDVDALVVVFVPPVAHVRATEHARALREAAAGLDKPLVTTFLAARG